MKEKNYYEILQISPLASPPAIQKAYRRLARKYHPDKNKNDPSAEEFFKDINRAYEVLSDEFKRKEFDRQIKKQKPVEQKSFTPMYDSFHTYSSSPLEKQTIEEQKRVSVPGQKISNWKNYWKNFFSNQKKPSHTSTSRICGNLELSLEEVALGGQKPLIVELQYNRQKRQEQLFVDIPAGVMDRQQLPVKGSKKFQNLSVVVLYKKHPLFKREGINVQMDLPISFTTAWLGGSVEVPTLRESLWVHLSPGTHNGHLIHLKKQGFFCIHSSKTGDMVMTVRIDIPSHFSSEEQNWIQKMHQSRTLCPSVAAFNVNCKKVLQQRQYRS